MLSALLPNPYRFQGQVTAPRPSGKFAASMRRGVVYARGRMNLENNIVFRGVIVAMFAIIMAISAGAASLLIWNLSETATILRDYGSRLSVVETRVEDLRRATP
jgi:hypothetical protein